MFNYRPFLQESACILAGSDKFKDAQQMMLVLEDSSSPVMVRHTEQLYQSVIEKGHIDFGGIAASKGNIRNYSGYIQMKNVLQIIQQMSAEEKTPAAAEAVEIVLKAIQNLEALTNEYEEGFRKHVDYVMLEYNSFAFCCVEATTTILSEFVEYIKRPENTRIDITLKNTKYRANLFYIEQLKQINRVNESSEYRKFLQSMNDKGQENFTGTAMLGMTAVMFVALSIVPLTRKLIFTFYDCRRRLANSMMLQASFLEMHKTCVEANTNFTPEKRKQILDKQERIRVLLIKGADKVRVQNVQAQRTADKELKKENQLMTFDKTKAGVDDETFSLL